MNPCLKYCLTPQSQQNSFRRASAQRGRRGSSPPEPPGGIPKQFVPSWIRWPIRVLFLPLVVLDLFAQRIARFLIRPPFKQAGTCKKRGPAAITSSSPLLKGFSGSSIISGIPRSSDFTDVLNGIYESEGHKVHVMGCRYLSKKGTCTRYALRPAVCRKWPMIEYFGYPRILKGCGFKAVYRD